MVNVVVRYFSLERTDPVVLGHKDVKRELILFTGVLAGSVGYWLFDIVQTGKFAWGGLILGIIASFVTFPTIYYNAGLDKAPAKASMSFVKWCVAFQNGFFWPSLIHQVSKGFLPPT